MKSVLITGVGGQDGSFLAEYLLSLGTYRVTGTVRGNPEVSEWIRPLLGKMDFLYMDLTDPASLELAIRKSWPDEIYNFAGQSNVPESWTRLSYTMQVDGAAVGELLKIVEYAKPDTRVYQASTGEMFGHKGSGGLCDEDTPLAPDSPYAIAKHTAHQLCGLYRRRGLHVSCGLTFNHESERRGFEMVTRKIARAAVNWACGSKEVMPIGNLESRRDWGFAGDYVKAFHKMLQQGKPDDYVIGTGQAYSVRGFIETSCKQLGIEVPWDRIQVLPQLVRKDDIAVQQGDASKAFDVLGWRPETDFAGLVARMVQAEQKRYQEKAIAVGRL